jgi:CO dehydrogenase nickel-insertion accessory protein CooC1
MGCIVRSNAHKKIISDLSEELNLKKLFYIYNRLKEFRAIHSSSFKTQTVLEGLFADMRLNRLN